MRGPSVSILVVLECEGREYAAIITQDSVAAAQVDFPQLAAGMLDGGTFSGIAAKEMEEELGIKIKESDMIDMIHLAYGGEFKGMVCFQLCSSL